MWVGVRLELVFELRVLWSVSWSWNCGYDLCFGLELEFELCCSLNRSSIWRGS